MTLLQLIENHPGPAILIGLGALLLIIAFVIYAGKKSNKDKE